MTDPGRSSNAVLAAALSACFLTQPAVPGEARDDGKDWPMYNRDVLGSRHDRGETAIGPGNAGKLEEKWRFPAKGSDLEIGVIHATPVVVGGHVYFGTATDPAFYKLAPDGKVRWSYRNPAYASAGGGGADRDARFQASDGGIFSSALVTEDTVYFGDTGGWFHESYFPKRATGVLHSFGLPGEDEVDRLGAGSE